MYMVCVDMLADGFACSPADLSANPSRHQLSTFVLACTRDRFAYYQPSSGDWVGRFSRRPSLFVIVLVVGTLVVNRLQRPK